MASQVSAPLLRQSNDGDNLATEIQAQESRSKEAHSEPAKAPPPDGPPQRLDGAIADILWALMCLSLPMLVLTAIFVGLVYGYEVSSDPEISENLLGVSTVRNRSAYYVDFSATRLITVSSWTSTVTSLTSAFVMVLTSYPLAKDYIRRSNLGEVESLPTVYQLKLIIGLLGGGFGPLWSWLQYCFWKRRNKQTKLLWMTVVSLLAATVLSIALVAVDTWLHFTTSTVNLDTLSPPVSTPVASYGRGLVPLCYNQTWTPGDINQCIGGLQLPESIHFDSASEATRTSMNLSTINSVMTSTVDDKHFAFLTSAQRDPNLDFRARTYAMSTTCSPASQACHLQQIEWCMYDNGCALGEVQMTLGMTYNCSPSLYGDLNNNTGFTFAAGNGSSYGTNSNIGFFLQMFRKQGFADPIGTVDGQLATPNPFFFAAGARVAASDALSLDPEAVEDDDQYNYAFIFQCTSAVYELEYASIAGNVVGDASNYTMANETLSNNVGWALLESRALVQNSLESAFFSGAQQVNTSQAFADYFASQFSRAALSMIAGITAGRLNVAEQTRQSRLVARLPKAPFFTLVSLNLLYALLGIVLAAMAVASQPGKTRNMQARLSIAGLVAALLEPNGVRRRGASRLAKGSNNGGIESVFAEYHDKDDSSGRVILVDSGTGNCVFEKVSSHSALAMVDAVHAVGVDAHPCGHLHAEDAASWSSPAQEGGSQGMLHDGAVPPSAREVVEDPQTTNMVRSADRADSV
ncbi:uncharacterized protein Z520_11154 [Fonsecaea multimorphosa CBS 102226]|uniref:Uncharacterized protein n=1 Tax=Fonsecaea multimorphosa CBS 102226 TaxID=1442371 RepID=A0A0D2JIT5_9EURO|nr:uncharacterized protein Z520_11154 [Fonsecaea multimorphosa CBS 102226]KIX93097.1 hypothetical protein Z520_11154 [Fonsecaea multimorphosa CBS 102226]OAL18395.1 hypothetical protein AYO22_10715 [Fonsecaea multimorphosa]